MWKYFEGLINAFPDQVTASDSSAKPASTTPENTNQPPTNFFGFIRFYSRGIWKFLVAVSIISALIALGEALFFYYIGLFVDELNVATTSTYWEVCGTTVLSFLALVVVILPLLSLVHHLLLNQTIRANYPMQIRYRMHLYLLKQSLGFFASDYSGRISQKVMQTALGVREVVIKFTNVIVHIVVYFITMLGMLWEADYHLMLLLLIWLALYVTIMAVFIPKLRRQSDINAERRSVMMGGIVDSYANIQTVKLFSKNRLEEEYARDIMRSALSSEYQMMRLVTKFDLSVQIINYLLIAALVLMSLFLWKNGIVLVGSVAVSLGLAIRINNLSQWVMWEVGMLFENIGNVQNGMQTITKPLEVKDPQTPVSAEGIKGHIEFKDVNFSYNGRVPVFTHLNLSIKPGERIGIVGQSGSGKSTLLNLLLRFYDVNSGSILLDGTDIRNFKQDELRSQIAMVSQDTSLLHRSIRENILYGRVFVSGEHELAEASLREAADRACALEFIEELSDNFGNSGFDTQVGDRGVRLSGGQRQRIALARVILRNSPILVLDEATSALDSNVEESIKKNLKLLMENKTVIAVAHRLSTIAQMDRLIVLDHGVIAETGTHAELIAKGGIYAGLWQRQTDGFIANK